MRPLTKDEEEKLDFLDTIFCALPCEELKRMAEEEEVIAILKDRPIATGIFRGLHDDNIKLQSDMATLRQHIWTIENDLKELIRILNKGTYNSGVQADFNNLKSRNCIY